MPVVSINYAGAEAHGWGPDPKFPHTSLAIASYAAGFVETASAIREAYPGKRILFEVMRSPWSNTTPEANGEEYADVVAAVLPAAEAAGIPLDDVYVGATNYDVNASEEWQAGWVQAMYAADPALESEVGGWATEPFGPATGTESGIEELPGLRESMKSGENNLIVSAIGFCSTEVEEGAGCEFDPPEETTTEAEAAEDLTTILTTALGYHEEGWLKALLVYARSEGGWSLQRGNGQITAQGKALDQFAEATFFPKTGQPGWYTLAEDEGSESALVGVNVVGGNLFVENEDVIPSEADEQVGLNRYYNSFAPPSQSNGLGPRWSWGVGPSVYLAISGETMVLHGPNGYFVRLHKSGSSYVAPEEFEGVLTRNEDGSYTLSETEEGDTYQFNAFGVMTSYRNAKGEIFTVADTTISGRRLLHTITPSSGKALEVKYNSTAYASEVKSPDGNVRKYAYNSHGQLTAFTNPSGEKTEYEYTKGYLSKIITPNETVETIISHDGRVSEVSVTAPDGEAYSDKFHYEVAQQPYCAPTDAGQTTITEEAESQPATSEVYCYDYRGVVTRYPEGGVEALEEEEGTEVGGGGFEYEGASSPDVTIIKPSEGSNQQRCHAHDLHVHGLDGETVFSIQTGRATKRGAKGVPVVTWGWELSSATAADIYAADPDANETLEWTADTFVNGRKIGGPPPHYLLFDTFHGSIGPKIYGSTRLKVGDEILLELEVKGYFTDGDTDQRVHGYADYECAVH